MAEQEDNAPRAKVIALGGGSSNAVLKYADKHSRRMREFAGPGNYEAGQLIEYVIFDTNVHALRANVHELAKLNVRHQGALIGEKTVGGRGTGQNSLYGEQSMRESITDGTIKRVIGSSEIIIPVFSLGRGGTGRKAARLFIEYCVNELHRLTIPILTTACYKRGEVTYQQSQEIEEELAELDKAGIAYARLLTGALYDHDSDLTQASAFKLLDSIQAHLAGAIMLLCAQPYEFDHSNVLNHLIVNKNQLEAKARNQTDQTKKKRWLLGSSEVVLTSDSGRNKEKLAQAMRDLVAQSKYFDVDVAELGGGVLTIEGQELPLSAYTVIRQALRDQLDVVYREKYGKDQHNRHLNVTEVAFRTGNPNSVLFNLWISEYTGDPEPKDWPDIVWQQPVELSAASGNSQPAVPVQSATPLSLPEAVVSAETSALSGKVQSIASPDSPTVSPKTTIIKKERVKDPTWEDFGERVFVLNSQGESIPLTLTAFIQFVLKRGNEVTSAVLSGATMYNAFVNPVRALAYQRAKLLNPDVKDTEFTYSPKAQEVEALMPNLARLEQKETISEGWKMDLLHVLLNAMEQNPAHKEYLPPLMSFDARPASGPPQRIDKTTSMEDMRKIVAVPGKWNPQDVDRVKRCLSYRIFFPDELYERLWEEAPAGVAAAAPVQKPEVAGSPSVTIKNLGGRVGKLFGLQPKDKSGYPPSNGHSNSNGNLPLSDELFSAVRQGPKETPGNGI